MHQIVAANPLAHSHIVPYSNTASFLIKTILYETKNILFMAKRFSNIFKTTNVTKLTKTILKSSYRVQEVTSKWKPLKQPVYFLRSVEFWPTFDIQISITLAIFLENLQNYTFYKSHRGLSKHVKVHINRATHYKIMALF